MTEYNKLNHWYGWNGGECPVHPKTTVEVVLSSGLVTSDAGGFAWGDDDDPVIAFKIVKEHKEPRDFWLYRDGSTAFSVHDDPPIARWEEIIHVREVIDD